MNEVKIKTNQIQIKIPQKEKLLISKKSLEKRGKIKKTAEVYSGVAKEWTEKKR